MHDRQTVAKMTPARRKAIRNRLKAMLLTGAAVEIPAVSVTEVNVTPDDILAAKRAARNIRDEYAAMDKRRKRGFRRRFGNVCGIR